MPHYWNNILVVTKEELVPVFFKTSTYLSVAINRFKGKNYGIQRVQVGGNGRQLLISFDSLPVEIQTKLGDPRKLTHILERYYRTDSEAVIFYANYAFLDGSYLNDDHQRKYVTNASVLKALLALKSERELQRRTKGNSIVGVNKTLSDDCNSFNRVLDVKHGIKHSLPENERRFLEALKGFSKTGYEYLISKKHKNNNSRKVYDDTVELLNNLFATDPVKPTATEIHRKYNLFLKGHLEIINNETGEVYQSADFKKISDSTVKLYLNKWTSKIATHSKRSGDRQVYMQNFKPYHSLLKPKFSGAIISIDDRQPPFKMPDGKRIWFYNGIDLGSEAFTCWVHGKSKEGIILEFYRQMVRNYATWGINLPAELEAEMSLNSSFMGTFLREGAMFNNVRIEANNARGKRIEAYYRQLRYQYEKHRTGWLARPHALSESNQQGSNKVPTVAYNEIVKGCLQDIEDWNNAPHSIHKDMSRWDVFLSMQHPNLTATNYKGFIKYLGYHTETSCRAAIVKLNNSEYLAGEGGMISLGEKLITLLERIEGKNIDVYWLDDNSGGVLKAFAYINDTYVCELIEKPAYSKAKIEQTDQDLKARQIMSSYVATIEAFGRNQYRNIDPVIIIDNSPKLAKSFIMPGLHTNVKNYEDNGQLLENIEDENNCTVETVFSFERKSLKDRL